MLLECITITIITMHLYPNVYGWNRQNLYAILLLRGKVTMYALEKNTSGVSIYLNREAVDVSYPRLSILTTVLDP